MGIINFIWLGNKALPKASIARIYQWLDLNPSAEIHIWVDRHSLPLEVARSYALPPPRGLRSPRIKFRDIDELPTLIASHDDSDASFKPNLRQLFELAQYEAGRLRPNYGAASDILRYLILYFNSGSTAAWSAYFDHDVAPGTAPVETTFAESSAGFFLSTNSQELGVAGNDAIICRAKHLPILRTLINRVAANYTKTTTPLPPTRTMLYGTNDRDDRLFDTMHKSGPQALVTAVAETYGHTWPAVSFRPSAAECNAVIPPASHAIPLAVCPGNLNEVTWLKVPVKPKGDVESALAAAVHSIRVEANLMGILRLDEHVADVVESLAEDAKMHPTVGTGQSFRVTSLGQPTLFETVIAKELVNRLEGLDLSHVVERQLISRYPRIREFYAARTSVIADGSARIGKNSALLFRELLTALPPGETPLTRQELQNIIDHWIPTIPRFISSAIRDIASLETCHAEIRAKQAFYLRQYLREILELIDESASRGLTFPITKDLLNSYIATLTPYIDPAELVDSFAAVASAAAGHSDMATLAATGGGAASTAQLDDDEGDAGESADDDEAGDGAAEPETRTDAPRI